MADEPPSELIDEPPITLEPSLGAVLPPEHILGRDATVDRYWQLLKTGNSLLLLAPRRIGKTSICTLLGSRAPDGFLVSYADVEGCDSGRAFVNLTTKLANKVLERGKAQRIKDLGFWGARKIKKVETGGVSVEINADTSVEVSLRRMLEDMEATCDTLGIELVLLWDEMPWFIDTLVKSAAYRDAKAILDGLRSHRQQQSRSRIRMIYTGSIGFFEVVDRLRKRAEYSARPANDMSLQQVPLLDTDGAWDLVAALVWNIEREGVLERRFVNHMAERCEGHPFIIQWVASELRQIDGSQPIGRDDVNRILDELVKADADPLDLEHYVARLEEFGWGKDARAILNIVAPRGGHGATVNHLANLLPEIDRGGIMDAVKRLKRDGYVTQDGDSLRFCVLLLARWWTQRHGLDNP